MNNDSATQSNGDNALTGGTFDYVPTKESDVIPDNVVEDKVEDIAKQDTSVEPNPPADTKQEDIVSDDKQKKSRVFDGLDEDEVRLFKSMSNDAYAKLYPAYLEYKNLKNQPTTIAEHPEAYTLDPEYQSIVSNLQSLSIEEDYWRDRIAEVENGAETIKWLIRDPNTGKYTEEEISVNPRIKAELIRNFVRAGEYKTRLQEEIERIKTKFTDSHKNFISSLKKVDEQVFGKLDLNNPTIKSTYESWLSSFPHSVRNLPVYQLLAKAMTAVQGLVHMLSVNEKRAKTAVGNKSPDSPIAGSGTLTTDEVDAQFERVLGR